VLKRVAVFAEGFALSKWLAFEVVVSEILAAVKMTREREDLCIGMGNRDWLRKGDTGVDQE
jgi:hypothetical protein